MENDFTQSTRFMNTQKVCWQIIVFFITSFFIDFFILNDWFPIIHNIASMSLSKNAVILEMILH